MKAPGKTAERPPSTNQRSIWHPQNPVKQTKTAEELAAMIHHDLSRLEGCPKQGVKVTVYGLNLTRILTAILATVLPRDKTILWAPILSAVLLGERGS